MVTFKVTGDRIQTTQAGRKVVVIGDPALPDWRYGVTAHLNRGHELYPSDAAIEQAAQMIGDLGVDVIRFDLIWALVQRNDGDRYDWSDYDFILELSQQYGFDLLPIIDHSAEWASAGRGARDWRDWAFAAPIPTEYAWFSFQAVERYRQNIHAWMIWNEPNLSMFWRPEPDPVRYSALLKHAYFAIKYADPEAVVVLGGLANADNARLPQSAPNSPESFLQTIYDEGGGPFFDVAARHPYTNPGQGAPALLKRLNDFRAVMVANGDGQKPIWVTEIGYPALPTSALTDEAQGRWVAQSLEVIDSTSHVPVTFWYNFREKGTDPDNWEHQFGLVENDFSVKPAYLAFQEYIRSNP